MINNLRKVQFSRILNVILNLIFSTVILVLYQNPLMCFFLANNLINLLLAVLSLIVMNQSEQSIFIMNNKIAQMNYDFKSNFFPNITLSETSSLPAEEFKDIEKWLKKLDSFTTA